MSISPSSRVLVAVARANMANEYSTLIMDRTDLVPHIRLTTT
ncbi:BZ3501_MvSof-1269-A2-R1_Chr12-3g03602 [Microbotryum saponariae]|nr:BZ3501_MvSof-1269-A2-R1_Chr12-3g03602 [Microbotryum saponariae]